MSSATFVPPSPGAWELERTHATRPMSRFSQDVITSMVDGFREATAAYGALLDYIELAIIDGFMYSAPRPVGAPKRAQGPPPKPIFKLMVMLHPEIRRRVKTAESVFRDRLWRKELEWWDREVKPSIAKEAQALLVEDLQSATPEQLVAHLRRAADFARRTVFFHHRLNCCAILPVSDLLVHATAWTGLTPQEVLGAMRGWSPLSAGAVVELSALKTALAADDEATALLLSDRSPRDIVDQLAARPTQVGAAMRQYLDVVGLRVIGGYDVADRHASEHPELLVNIIRSAVRAGQDAGRRGSADEAIQSIRARVPEAHRTEFDALLAEAQVTYRVRDERNFCGDAIGIGMLRRALLAIGERLTREGRLHDATHVVEASEAEVVSLLEGRGGPTADDLAARLDRRMRTTLDDAPERLGFPPSAPPPADWLPPAAARLQRAVDLALRLMFEVSKKSDNSRKQLKGFGVSPGTFEGPVRVIMNVADLPSVQAGEVLVTSSTGPTFNVVLPLLRAIVTERGGALSHAAIVAREYGIPAVVGCPGATQTVKTGMRVRVDGSKGEVWVIE